MGFGTSLHGAFGVLRLSAWVIGKTAIGNLDRKLADDKARRFARDLLDRAEVDLAVHGADRLPLDRPLVYMSNHQSLFDIPVLWATLPGTVRFVAKTELFRVPLWGRAMRLGEIIEVDRQDRRQAVAALRRGADLIRSGVSVWIAPEGHRSRDGSLGPLKRGGFHLAKDAGVDIVPIAIDGTIDVLPPKELSVRRRRRVEVTIGEPLATADADIDSLMTEVERFLRSHLDAHRGGSDTPPHG